MEHLQKIHEARFNGNWNDCRELVEKHYGNDTAKFLIDYTGFIEENITQDLKYKMLVKMIIVLNSTYKG